MTQTYKKKLIDVSIPLEAQRLGLPAYGSDLNPVAVMIGKATIEISPKFKDMEPTEINRPPPPPPPHELQVESSDRITVVFCTYQSLDRLSEAQKIGTPEFDLIICDEARHTTGIDKEKHPVSNQKNSNFFSVHNQDFISGRKRFYMTATPRIYTEQAQQKADVNDIGIFSIDDERQFGKEFYRLGFSQAVEEGMLSDYRVIVLTMDEASISSIISDRSKETVAGLSSSTDLAQRLDQIHPQFNA